MLKYGCNTCGGNTRFTKRPVKFLVQMSKIQHCYRPFYPAPVVLIQKKTLNCSLRVLKNLVNTHFYSFFQIVGVAKVLQHPQRNFKVHVVQMGWKQVLAYFSNTHFL